MATSGRKPLAPGRHGQIHYRKLGPRLWQARCRYRDVDGSDPAQLAAQGPSKPKAQKALLDKLRERGAGGLAELTADSRFSEAGTLWLAKVERDRRGSTYDTYRRWLENRVVPDIGNLRLVECTFGQLDAYMARLAAERTETGRSRYSANSLRNIRKVIAGPLRLAVKHKAIPASPVPDMDMIEGQGSSPRALTQEERRRLRRWLRGPLLEDPGARVAQVAARRRDLPDLVDFMLGTGVRVGEALAVRWCDVDLDGIPVANPDGTLRVAPVVSISGNIVRVKGRGLVRHPGKTPKAIRTLELPRFVVAMLVARRPEALPANSEMPVFAAAGPRGVTWKDPNNTQTYIREMRDALGWLWMTSHNWRETAITVWSDSSLMPLRATSDIAGHSDPNFTLKTYVGRGAFHPQAAAIQDAAHADD